jgi:hypothetical protein
VIASSRRAVASVALLTAALLVGCGGSDATTGNTEAQQQEKALPTAGRDSSPEAHQERARVPGSQRLLPANFEQRVLASSDQHVGVVIAPLAGDKTWTFGNSQPPHAWSTIKPLIAVAVLRARRDGKLPGGRTTTNSERDLIGRAIKNSDNAAAAELFHELGAAPFRRSNSSAFLRRCRDNPISHLAWAKSRCPAALDHSVRVPVVAMGLENSSKSSGLCEVPAAHHGRGSTVEAETPAASRRR